MNSWREGFALPHHEETGSTRANTAACNHVGTFSGMMLHTTAFHMLHTNFSAMPVRYCTMLHTSNKCVGGGHGRIESGEYRVGSREWGVGSGE